MMLYQIQGKVCYETQQLTSIYVGSVNASPRLPILLDTRIRYVRYNITEFIGVIFKAIKYNVIILTTRIQRRR